MCSLMCLHQKARAEVYISYCQGTVTGTGVVGQYSYVLLGVSVCIACMCCHVGTQKACGQPGAAAAAIPAIREAEVPSQT